MMKFWKFLKCVNKLFVVESHFCHKRKPIQYQIQQRTKNDPTTTGNAATMLGLLPASNI